MPADSFLESGGQVYTSIISGCLVFAQDGGDGAGGILNVLGSFPVLVVALLFFFFILVLRPQRREQARRQAMLMALKKNDRVLTTAGIFGIVANVQREKNEVTIRVDEENNTKLRLALNAIAEVVSEESVEGEKK
jgi:preprotein translocase subunit YajC